MSEPMRTQTKLIVLFALVIGLQLGYMIGNRGGDPLPVVSRATASGLVVQNNGELVTSSPDGTKIFVWYPSSERSTYERVKYENIAFTASGR